MNWVVRGTIGPESLGAGLFSAGWSTLVNRPRTYGPHWEGFGDRYGIRLSGIGLSNTMEAGLGAFWGIRGTGGTPARRFSIDWGTQQK